MRTSLPGLRWFYRIAYGLFLALAAYQALLRDDPVGAAGSAGIGLIFDPFNPDQPCTKVQARLGTHSCYRVE